MGHPRSFLSGHAPRLAVLGAALAAIAGSAANATPGSTPDLTVLHAFSYQPDGEYPEGRLVQGPDGTLYGTTYEGGAYGVGMIFAIAPDGTFSTLHSFAGPEGQQLSSGLVFGADGALYGTAPQGLVCVNQSCTGNGGTVFRVTTDGTFQTLYTFPGNGLPTGYGPGELTLGSDGNFYGVTGGGGPSGVGGLGTVFRITPSGQLTTLHAFTADEPHNPGPKLTEGADGNFYGAASSAPGTTNGVLFSVSPAGVLTTVYTFSGGDGAGPNGALLLARDGNFYGTTVAGGAHGAGTLYRLTPSGTLTTLYAFPPGEAAPPDPGLVETADGSLYGVTGGGGAANGGTLFRLARSGAAGIVHLFEYVDGTNPAGAPILGQDGKLYGTTTQGGGGSLPTGSVYAFDPTATHPPVLSLTKFCFNELNECLPPFDSVVGGTVGLSWYSANLSRCQASGFWRGAKPIGGSVTFKTPVAGRFPYTLQCTGAAGPVSATVTVTVGR